MGCYSDRLLGLGRAVGDILVLRGRRRSVELTHGSLLIMRAATQHNWLHQVPKTAKEVAERVNLTFRVVLGPTIPGGSG